jgi:hypothetical protein
MTRPDFLEGSFYWYVLLTVSPSTLFAALDRANIIAIVVSTLVGILSSILQFTDIVTMQIHHDVRPDSMLVLHAARQVVEEEGFDDVLDNVRARVDEIESLHRTRELTVCTIHLKLWYYIGVLNIAQFKDVDKGDRIRLSVDKGGSLLVES